MQPKLLQLVAGLGGLGGGYLFFKKALYPKWKPEDKIYGMVPKRSIASLAAGGVAIYIGSGMEGPLKVGLMAFGGGVLMGEGLSW
ncbi:MAG: hypothetical protein QXR87_03315 [Candidatus Hadarchaeales archaeon]